MIDVLKVTHPLTLWPDAASRDYDALHAVRETVSRRLPDGREVCWRSHYYDPYSAYRKGDSIPEGMPIGRAINNVIWLAPDHVQDRVIDDLTRIARECPVLWWDSAIQCSPKIASHLKRLFRLSILNFGDDMPGSSHVKTFPVLNGFDVLVHMMWVWDVDTGRLVKDVYAERGLRDCRFVAWGPSGDFLDEGVFERKVAALRSGCLPIEMIWLGNFGIAPRRQAALREVLRVSRPSWRFYGFRMRDGQWEGSPTDLYAQSVFGINVPEASHFNLRFADLCASGTVQVACDRYGELAHFGFVDGEHFVGYDGTGEGLLRVIDRVRGDGEALERIARAARKRFFEYRAEHEEVDVFGGVLLDHDGGRL